MTGTAKNAPQHLLMRPSVPVLDEMLGIPHECLDHGFIRLIDYMGDEAAVVQAARVSYGTGTKTLSSDRGLLRYLMRRHHTTPFEMCEIKVHMKLPIFVARQWIRHRTANVNEYSARYSILANEFFVPDPMDIQGQSLSNNQGREGMFSEEMATAMSRTIEHHGGNSYQLYEELMHGWPWVDSEGDPWNMDSPDCQTPHKGGHGMARELARMVLPVNAYTEWYWKVDLHNLLHLLRLRTDPHAQKEIRAYADVLAQIVQQWVPNIWEAFEEYQLNACTFSSTEMEMVRTLVARNPAATRDMVDHMDLSKTERTDFFEKIQLGMTE